MSTLTMGILAHVDAGKTSLTERLLYAAGVIDRVGRVDDGSTQTDSMDLERRRGITIRSAVVSFELPAPEPTDLAAPAQPRPAAYGRPDPAVPDQPGLSPPDRSSLTVNLIDTPGHSDFIAEVERALSVLDGAVLVISAVEGVQVQTRLLMRTLTRLRIPTLLFVNKIDRMGPRYDDLLADIRRLLTPAVIPLGFVEDLGVRNACYVPFDLQDKMLAEVLAERNDAFLARYLDDDLTPGDYPAELARQVAESLVRPVYFGSAMTGVGVPELIEGIRTLLPRAIDSTDEPLQASVFKVERGPAGEKIASARVFAGVLHSRQPIDVYRSGPSYGGPHGEPSYRAKPTGIRIFERGGTRAVDQVEAGRIVALRGVKEIRIGDQLGRPGERGGQLFAPPSLETVVRSADRVKLYQALQQLAEQDPLIRVRKEDEISVSLYGEVQKEVIASLLESEYGLAVTFSETQPIHVERPNGVGAAYREIGDPRNLWAAAVGFRISPAPVGTGIDYRLEVELGGLPRAFHTAIEETARQSLQQGLYGWEVTDLRLDLTHTGYIAPVSVAADFRRLVPLVLMEALQQAGTTVHEPVHRFELDLPPDSVAPVIGKLAESAATVEHTEVLPEHARLTGLIPAGRINGFEIQLPGLTHGEGVLLTTFEAYLPVTGTPPYRARTDGNPLNQKEYVLHLNQA